MEMQLSEGSRCRRVPQQGSVAIDVYGVIHGINFDRVGHSHLHLARRGPFRADGVVFFVPPMSASGGEADMPSWACLQMTQNGHRARSSQVR